MGRHAEWLYPSSNGMKPGMDLGIVQEALVLWLKLIPRFGLISCSFACNGKGYANGPAGREKMSPGAPGARRARTDFRVIARSGRIGAWVGLMPETGRTHQLRAHMAAIGTPILGDTKYRGDKPVPETAPPGLMLHARELDLPHPAGGRLRLKAEPPQGFRDGLAWLGLVPEPIRFTAIADWHEEE